MESSSMEGDTDSPPRTFSQVAFHAIPHSYPLSTSITCAYTLSNVFQANPRDWVGIFKVGWTTIKDYHTFVWVEPYLDVGRQQPVTRQAVFKEYYLPKDEIDFYQFCYVDSTGQVRGASSPFCFRQLVEQSVSNQDDDLLIITTQEQLEESKHEKTELQRELSQITEENYTLKRALEKEQQEVTSLKEQNEQNEKEKTELVEELDQIKEQHENAKQQLKEMDQLKETLTQLTNQIEMQESNVAEQGDRASIQDEMFDQTVMEVQQFKEEHEELRIGEENSELLKMKDSIQLLSVDLQNSEKERERLSADLQRLQILAQNMDDIKSENQELLKRLSQQEALQNYPDEGLRKKLKEALEVIEEKDSIIKEEEHLIALLSQEKEELARKNETLTSEIEGLHSVIADLHDAHPADSSHMKPDTTSPAGATSPTQGQEPEMPEEAEIQHDNTGVFAEQEEELLVCRHCQERFPLITKQELMEHEQSHRICPFCALVCDNMEQSVFEDHVYGHEM
ncbi:calcium-binding and coiled-coil domain-containing protein 2 [Antennarius striatus]|uniref:calcium-binding and coiled-coil domain-containing protein 2 n=1 Tax=Antennarius striatus TaxID=241820 RepID=UPI0035B26DE4